MSLVLEYFLTLCFAYVGASLALNNQLSKVRIVISAFLVATGGGSTRDVLLDKGTLFWIDNPMYMLAVLIAIPLALSKRGIPRISLPFYQLLDSLGTTVFIMVGIGMAIEADCHWVVVLFLGVLTGIGGGIIHQLLFERRSVVGNNSMSVFSATLVSLLYIVALHLETSKAVSIIGLTLVHLLLIECHRKIKLKVKHGKPTLGHI